MTAFSTMSSAAFVFSVASGSIVSRRAPSRSSASLSFAACSTFCFVVCMLLISLARLFCVFSSCAASFSKPWTSPTTVFCVVAILFATNPAAFTNGSNDFSASTKASGQVPSPTASFADARASTLSVSTLATSALSFRSFSSASAFSCNSLLTTTRVCRTGPSQGMVQPAFGGSNPLSLQCDQTWVPPSLLPNHHPSKAGPSRLSQ
mmetsp:Transcript_6468/g.18069  ORF Transcript_6468/g.18069 Transcript_6468/m.18069 type:complete len:206 (-) Transcript_6468:588-1205(-)